MPELEEEKLLTELCDLAERAGIRVIRSREAGLLQGGATGKVRDQALVVLDSRAGLKRRIEVIIQALKKIDWRDRYLKPSLRRLLEGGEDESA